MLRLTDCTIWHVLYLLELSEFRTRDPVHTDYVRNLSDTMRTCSDFLAAGESLLRRSNPVLRVRPSSTRTAALHRQQYPFPNRKVEMMKKSEDAAEDFTDPGRGKMNNLAINQADLDSCPDRMAALFRRNNRFFGAALRVPLTVCRETCPSCEHCLRRRNTRVPNTMSSRSSPPPNVVRQTRTTMTTRTAETRTTYTEYTPKTNSSRGITWRDDTAWERRRSFHAPKPQSEPTEFTAEHAHTTESYSNLPREPVSS